MKKETKENIQISYRDTEEIQCPVCGNYIQKEIIMSGRGRLITGELTLEFYQKYTPSQKWGKIYPLVYAILVCPKCLYASYFKDFSDVDSEEIRTLKENTDKRKKLVNIIFNELNFQEDRNIILGTASYLLAVDCYHFRNSEIAPTFKKAACCIRAAWLLGEMKEIFSYRPYDKTQNFYYREACIFFNLALEILETEAEPIEKANYVLNPKITSNWTFDATVYLSAYLNIKYLNEIVETKFEKINILEKNKKHLSMVYGRGQYSIEKPAIFIDRIKDVYDNISKYLEKMK